MAEAEDLKSFKCGFDPHSRYVAKEDALTKAIDKMGRETFRFHHFMVEEVENPIVLRQVMGLMASAMPNAYAAFKELLSAVDKVKLEGHAEWQ